MVLCSVMRSMRYSRVQKRLDRHRNKRQRRSDETRCVQVANEILWNIGLYTFCHRRHRGIHKNNFFRTVRQKCTDEPPRVSHHLDIL